MPIISLKQGIAEYLTKIDYVSAGQQNFFPLNTLKNSIINDANVRVNIVDRSVFYVQINASDYYEMIANTFFYNHSRFEEHCKQITYLEHSSSSAWLLTTIYYACFFAANEITNLHGIFNLTITNDEKKKLIPKNISEEHDKVRDFLSKGPNHFYGKASYIPRSKTVQIRFESGGGKPHELAWMNLNRILTYDSLGTSRRLNHMSRLKFILEKTHKWKRPNQIRNEWNYSRPELYLDEGNIFRDSISQYLNNFEKLNQWAGRGKIVRKNDEDDIVSILFLFNILKSVIAEQKQHLLV